MFKIKKNVTNLLEYLIAAIFIYNCNSIWITVPSLRRLINISYVILICISFIYILLSLNSQSRNNILKLGNAINNAPKAKDIVDMLNHAVKLQTEIPDLCQKFKKTFEQDNLGVNAAKAVAKLDYKKIKEISEIAFFVNDIDETPNFIISVDHGREPGKVRYDNQYIFVQIAYSGGYPFSISVDIRSLPS